MFNANKFNKSVDLEGLRKDYEEAKENGGNFSEVPTGTYEVSINKMELGESKNENPMFICWFKVLSGDHKNQLIFMNQVINKGFGIHTVCEFLRSLEALEDDSEIRFENYEQFNKLVMDVAEAIDTQKLEYGLEYGENAKGYKTFKITDVFES